MTDKQTSTILKGIQIKGEIKGDGNIRIEGEVDGEVSIGGNCSIEDRGMVKGNVSSNSLVISGSVVGNIQATDRIEIQATGKIEGDIKVPRISIADGASVNGNVNVGENISK